MARTESRSRRAPGDFRKTERMKLYSDSVWFWRISEGVPNTKMKAWKSKLPEEDRWKAMAYERTFGLKGMGYDELGRTGSRWPNSGNRHQQPRPQLAGRLLWLVTASLRRRRLPKMPRRRMEK